MMICIIVFLLVISGLFVVFGVNPVIGLIRIIRNRKPKTKENKETAGEFVRRLEGRKRMNLVQRSLRETHNALVIIGQERRYNRVVRMAALAGVAGAAAGILIFKSPLLTIVLGLGCGMIPLWRTNLSVYEHAKHVNNELETTLSMVTIAYVRHNDIVKAIREAIPHAGEPVKGVMEKMVGTVSMINGDIEGAIRKMKDNLDNVIFHQWCDILILCQSDHTLKAGLMPIVSKLSELKSQQDENETLMMMPLRDIIFMIMIVLSVFPLLYLLNQDWYHYLVHTFWGQVSICGVAIVVV